MLLLNIVNCLCEDGGVSFATCFKRVQDCSESVPNIYRGLVFHCRSKCQRVADMLQTCCFNAQQLGRSTQNYNLKYVYQ